MRGDLSPLRNRAVRDAKVAGNPNAEAALLVEKFKKLFHASLIAPLTFSRKPYVSLTVWEFFGVRGKMFVWLSFAPISKKVRPGISSGIGGSIAGIRSKSWRK
jgi:hypothetical protein